MKKYLFLWIVLVALISSQGSAQSQFVKYKKYLIPISAGLCPDLQDNGKENVIYIDDIAEHDRGDVNGVQDLAVVLGLNDKVNLLLVGVGRQRNDVPPLDDDVLLAENIVGNTTQDHVPVLSGTALKNEIIRYANCSTVKQKLIIAIGGPWYDLRDALLEDPTISSKVRAIGIGGWNILSGGAGPNAPSAHTSIKTALGSENVITIPDNSVNPQLGFRSPYDADGFCNRNCLNLIYDTKVKTVLNGVTDSNVPPISLVSNTDYSSEQMNYDQGQGYHRLRIADFLTVALASGEWSYDDILNKAIIHPAIKTGLDRL